MALANVGFNIARILHQSGTHSITPLAALRTSATAFKYDENRKWHWWNWLFPLKIKPEYDEKGELGFPDGDELFVGMAKKELDARRAGDQDPYGLMPYYYIQGKYDGTKLDPIMVPSAYESKLIACLCEPEAQCRITMWLHQNEPARCGCGFWFLLYYKEPFLDYSTPCD